MRASVVHEQHDNQDRACGEVTGSRPSVEAGRRQLAGFALVGWQYFPTYPADPLLFATTFTRVAISLAAWEIHFS